MKIALTANGPGEVAGWVRPLLRRLYALDPELEAHLFLVPDDFATGREAELARSLFPRARVYEPREYVAFALGRRVAQAPSRVDVVQYLGGDLMHAARLHKRLCGRAFSYKFSKPRYRSLFCGAFAVDAKNAYELAATGIPAERITVVGNLAIDGAFDEAALAPEDGTPDDGILIMPGSRRYEVEHLIPFFFTTALQIRREQPQTPIAFGIAPFTSLQSVGSAIEAGGDRNVFAQRGRLIVEGERAWLADRQDSRRFPIVRASLAAATRARLAVTLPGTKVIELAALGVPTVTITPLNAPEKIAINGPLTYLDRLPLIGVPLKRAVVTAVSRRFAFHTQPNIDLDEMLVRELHGTLTPGRVARVALESYADIAWQRSCRQRLPGLYRAHAGAAERMAKALF